MINKCENLLIWLVVLLQSCDGKLDIPIADVIDSRVAVRSLDDLNTVLIGAYYTLQRDGLYQESMVYLPDLMADNLRIANTNGGSLRTEANWLYDPSTDIDTWNDAYALVSRANNVIGIAGRFEDGGKKNRIVGQALALRGLAYFDLLRYYGVSYERNFSEEHSGVPIILTFGELEKPARKTVKEVYDRIFEDLDNAISMLDNVDVPIQSPYFFDKRAVNALMARVFLYAGQWENAVRNATSIIDASSLAIGDDYAEMWKNDEVGELLFGVPYSTPDEGLMASRLYRAREVNGTVVVGYSFTLTADAVALYNEATDVRYSLFVTDNDNTSAGDDKNLVFKYPGRGDQPGLNNAKVLRVSEMYLIRAEANFNLSNETVALRDLNTLRKARIIGYTNETLSGSDLMDAIQIERRKELLVEGHRWFDLRRLGQGVTRGEDCRGLTINCMLEAGNFRFAFPILDQEIEVNPNIKQNRGY